MAKKVSKKDIKELIVFCLKQVFPIEKQESPEDNKVVLEELKNSILIDSIYIEIKDVYLITEGKCPNRIYLMKLNRYFRRYAGKNLICKYYNKEKDALIIKNDYQTID